mmetsp:Transcript_60462/g.184721  ORF Transcript_60462/g.184721 Transcript_60462/m.184721 type:complete len:213 (+) Transcript_60462:941-1579(+)
MSMNTKFLVRYEANMRTTKGVSSKDRMSRSARTCSVTCACSMWALDSRLSAYSCSVFESLTRNTAPKPPSPSLAIVCNELKRMSHDGELDTDALLALSKYSSTPAVKSGASASSAATSTHWRRFFKIAPWKHKHVKPSGPATTLKVAFASPRKMARSPNVPPRNSCASTVSLSAPPSPVAALREMKQLPFSMMYHIMPFLGLSCCRTSWPGS